MSKMKKNWTILGITLIIGVILVAGCVTINTQAPTSTTQPTSMVTVIPTVVPTEVITTTIQTPTMVTTQTPIVTATKSPSVGPLISICSWQLNELAQMGIRGSPFPLIHTYIDKYDPKRDPNYQVDYKTKYSQYWMNPTTGSFDPTIVRPLLSLTSRDSVSQNYYVETIFYDANVKPISTTDGNANNGYAWINVDPKQTVVAEVVAPDNASCYKINKVCTVTNGEYKCAFFDVVSSK
jgi:hypothetical protein